MESLEQELIRIRALNDTLSNNDYTAAKKKIKILTQQFQDQIVKTEEYHNREGYAYHEAEMYKHYLKNGNYIISGYPFSTWKASCVGVFNLYSPDGELIERFGA
jgi:hypothetical protein